MKKNHGDYFCVSVAGYPEGHPDNIEEVDSFESLTASEQRRARVAPNAEGKTVVTAPRQSLRDRENSSLKEIISF